MDALSEIDKVLRLEERKGYRDSAATAGVTRFVGERVARLVAAADDASRARVQQLDRLLVDYARLSESERVARVAESRRLVRELIDRPPAPSLTSGSAPAQRTAAFSRVSPSPGSLSGARPPAAKRATSRANIASLSDSVRLLPRVGDARAKQLEQLGVRTVRDLLRLYPRRHDDYSNIQPIGSLLFGTASTVQGIVRSVDVHRTPSGKPMAVVVVSDGTGEVSAVWFNPHVTKVLRPGMSIALSGRVEQRRGNLSLTSPEWEALDRESLNTGRLIPIYPLVKGLYQKTLRPLVRETLDSVRHLIVDPLPDDMRQREGLIGLADATEWIHFPDGPTPEDARRNLERARRRIAFDEFLVLQIGLLRRKASWSTMPGNAIEQNRDELRQFGESLPYTFTNAQRRALAEILRDMARPTPMTRLLQGDVGSGKTVVAASAAFVAIRAGYQATLMAPTEILAEQHERGLRALFDNLPESLRPRMALISGNVSRAKRSAVYAAADDGSLDLVVGTHALIQEGLAFRRLGLAIVDEQHRFGVEQRATLRAKGENADILVMTATPIPRTLALTLHGDLDVSTLDELPPGRQPIDTRWLPDRRRDEAYEFVRDEVAKRRQAFIVFPLVEESDTVEARAAVAEHERLRREVFPSLRLGLLHGRMKSTEKDAVMTEFRDGQIDILVSTSVVEVGIDVPNATVMVIDGADRFGLSQLHQFRGRVGRGGERSTCILISGDASQDARTRLQALVDYQDGFRLAQIDLELRGPGEFLGTRQSGMPEMDLGALTDVRDLERARASAERLLDDDPDLAKAEHALLRARVDAFWSKTVADVS